MKDELATLLYEQVRADNEVRVFEHWHYSSLAECPRTQYFKRLGIEPLTTVGAGKMLRWKAGHIIEEVVRPYLERIYPGLTSNIRMTDEDDDATGEFDNYSEDQATLIEIKSVNGYAFRYRKVSEHRTHLRGEKPYPSHMLQNHGYVRQLRKRGKPVEFIHFVYISLDGLIATYKVPVSQTYLADVEQRLKTLNTAWASQTPPECICNDQDHLYYKSTLQYCDYKQGDDCCSLSLITKKEK
jgi:hypothetical protein